MVGQKEMIICFMQEQGNTDIVFSTNVPYIQIMSCILVKVTGQSVEPCIHERAEWFANQMRMCVNGTANLRCAICKRVAYHSARTKICRFFARTQRELDAPGVLCSPQVRGKLINRAPNMCHKRMAQCTRVYKGLSCSHYTQSSSKYCQCYCVTRN